MKKFFIQITDHNSKKLQDYDSILTDFYADWCAPCKQMSRTLSQVQLSKQVSMLKINIDLEPEIPTQFKIMSIPTLILFKKGHETSRLVGQATDVVAITEWLEKII